MARGIVNDRICALCRRELEMIIHALRACDVVKTNWNPLEINHFDSDFFSCKGWAKLNTDGSCLGNPGICGGVVQDELGGWLGGFSSKIGITTSFLAKLWALRDGLILCQNLQLTALEIELDAKAIVDLLANSSYSFAQKKKKKKLTL